MVRGMINSIFSPSPPFDFYAPLLANCVHLCQPTPLPPYKPTMTAFIVLIKQWNLERSMPG